jgi:lipid-binding SYLF domain-containing protein
MSKKPNFISMEGMVWNANNVLDHALDPKTNGVPRYLFSMCKGVLLISIAEVGLIFKGSVGTGVVMARNHKRWSAPSAVGLAGIGWG